MAWRQTGNKQLPEPMTIQFTGTYRQVSNILGSMASH